MTVPAPRIERREGAPTQQLGMIGMPFNRGFGQRGLRAIERRGESIGSVQVPLAASQPQQRLRAPPRRQFRRQRQAALDGLEGARKILALDAQHVAEVDRGVGARIGVGRCAERIDDGLDAFELSLRIFVRVGGDERVAEPAQRARVGERGFAIDVAAQLDLAPRERDEVVRVRLDAEILARRIDCLRKRVGDFA